MVEKKKTSHGTVPCVIVTVINSLLSSRVCLDGPAAEVHGGGGSGRVSRRPLRPPSSDSDSHLVQVSL
jgi:hypothetical protein